MHLEGPPRHHDHGRRRAGTVRHIASASQDADHLAREQRVRDAGGLVTDVRGRDDFAAISFREPRGGLLSRPEASPPLRSGVATLSPGLAVDEDPKRLGEALRVPAMHAHLRERLERTLTPLVDPRTARHDQVTA